MGEKEATLYGRPMSYWMELRRYEKRAIELGVDHVITENAQMRAKVHYAEGMIREAARYFGLVDKFGDKNES